MDVLVAWELLAVVVLIAINGCLTAAEIAVVAADREKLADLAQGGDRGAKSALELAQTPQRWLPILQAGVSFLSTLAAALAAVHITPWLADRIEFPSSVILRQLMALMVIVTGVTALSVIVGEVAPRRAALHFALPLARLLARPVTWLSNLGRPLLWLAGRSSSDWLVTLVSVHGNSPARVSRSEIESLIERGTEAGVVQPLEQRIAMEALRLGDVQVRQIMRPRADIDAADVETPPDEVLGVLAMAGFSRIPVYEGDLDHILGIVHLKDVLRQQYLNWDLTLRKLVHPALFVPDTLRIDRLLALFRERREHMAIVVDEFGATRGMVTIEDVLHELMGDLVSSQTTLKQPALVRRDDGSWLVDGKTAIVDLLEQLGRTNLSENAPKLVNTVAGLVLTQLNHIPRVGEKTVWQDLQLEVLDMDGQRIDQLLVSERPDEKVDMSSAP